MFVVNIVHAGIYSEYFHSFLLCLSGDPFLVLFVDSLNVVKTDVFLSFSISDLDSLLADFWRTLKVDNSLNWTVLDQCVANRVVDFVLVGLEVTVLVHDLSENVSVSQGGSLRKQEFVLLFFGGFLP